MTATDTTVERLWTAQEVADHLGVTHWWVSSAGRKGELPRVQVGRYVRYSPAAIRDWQAAQTTPAVSVGRTPRARAQAKRRAA